MLTLKYADLKLTKRLATALTLYFYPGKSLISETYYPYSTTFIKTNYIVKQEDVKKTRWGLLYTWLVWKQDRRDFHISYHKLPNENIHWVIQYYKENGQIDFLFYPPYEPTKPYLIYSLVNNRITTLIQPLNY